MRADESLVAKKKAAVKCAAALHAASAALHAFMKACNAVDDGGQVRGIDDGRIILAASCEEYAQWLEDTNR